MHKGTSAQGEAALYVVATPIGNLQDVTLRALEVLRSVAVIAAEDTRVTRTLLAHFGIDVPTLALHEHNEAQKAQRVIELLVDGKSVALVSDAGTPAVSDPGALLVRRVRDAGLRVVPIPGVSALTAAVSVAGLTEGRFLFLGFLPAQAAARRSAIQSIAAVREALVMYESPHRMRDTVGDLEHVLGGEREIVIARELTKMFETVHACRLGEAGAWLDADPHRLKGEFVLVVSGAPAQAEVEGEDQDRVLGILLAQLPLKQAVQLAAQITGGKRNALYQRALEMKKQP